MTSKLAEVNLPVAIPPQWMPVLLGNVAATPQPPLNFLCINNHWPLLETQMAANEASRLGTSHRHVFDSITYYMPNGFTGTWHGQPGFTCADLAVPPPPPPPPAPPPAPAPSPAPPLSSLLKLSATATLSSTYRTQNYFGSDCVDGDLDNFCHSSTTPPDTDPSLTLDFGTAIQIAYVAVYNRRDCCQDRLADYTVSYRVRSSDAWAVCAEATAAADAIGPLLSECPHLAQYVRVQLPGSGRILNLAEVEVYTLPPPSPSPPCLGSRAAFGSPLGKYSATNVPAGNGASVTRVELVYAAENVSTGLVPYTLFLEGCRFDFTSTPPKCVPFPEKPNETVAGLTGRFVDDPNGSMFIPVPEIAAANGIFTFRWCPQQKYFLVTVFEEGPYKTVTRKYFC